MLINRFSMLTAVMITVICAYMAYSFAVTLRRGTEELADINMKAAESIRVFHAAAGFCLSPCVTRF